MKVFSDLHIHIGRTKENQPVKITASPNLTLFEILRTAYEEKGLNLVGIVDAACKGVLFQLQEAVAEEKLVPINGGGYVYQDKVVLFLGSEVEIAHLGGGSAHFLAYFPTLTDIQAYSTSLRPFVTNPTLSTQKLRLSGNHWLEIVSDHNGIVLAAHAFTPHKGVYGNCVSQLKEMFTHPDKIIGLELGLSADIHMAQSIKDTHSYPYIASSDAHSLGNIGREFTVYEMPALNFNQWVKVLKGEEGRIAAVHGMNPLLGKYYRSYCPDCHYTAEEMEAVFTCPHCSNRMVNGVWDRIMQLKDASEPFPSRPPYISHIPLRMIPGVGERTYRKLLNTLGSEIDILYRTSINDIAQIAGPRIAHQITASRSGTLSLIPGGGGKYGRVAKSMER